MRLSRVMYLRGGPADARQVLVAAGTSRLAVAGQCEFIITHNVRDFADAERFGVRAVAPREFLAIMEKEP